jgi:hypothetical protein
MKSNKLFDTIKKKETYLVSFFCAYIFTKVLSNFLLRLNINKKRP